MSSHLDVTTTRLLLLGAPTLLRDGQAISFRTRKALALLCYLAASPGPHPRERLLALLWPAADEGRGRANLRTALLYLRDALGPTASLLRAEGGLLALAPAILDVDVVTLEAAHALATALSPEDAGAAAAGVPAAAVAAPLARAAALYRGPFLDGLALPDAPEFEAWAGGQRAWWARRARVVFLRLAALQREGGAPKGEAETLERWLGHEPGDEGAWQALLGAYGAAGAAAAVRHAYARCRAALRATLDAEPDAHTRALAAPAEAGADAPGRDATPAGAWLGGTLPLVGRAREVAALRAAYARAAAGRPTLALVLGQAGIGKSRLAAELAGWAAARGAMVLEGRAFAVGAGLPYAPLTAALRARLERENAPDDLLTDVWLAELARLLPELRERYPDLPPPMADPTLGPARLFEAVARLLGALAGRGQGPLLLILDDAQWADVGTRDLARYLVRGWAAGGVTGTRALLMVAARTEDAAADAGLAEWLAALERDVADGTGSATRLRLGPLDRGDTIRLAATLSGPEDGVRPAPGQEGDPGDQGDAEAGAGAAARLGAWLHARTGGQPFYLAETLRALLEAGALGLRAAPGGGWALDLAALDLAALPATPPGRVQEAIRARLGRLDESTMALLRAGAALGSSFGFATACRVAVLDEEAGLAALDEARLGLLREVVGDGAVGTGATYAFGHDLVREVVYQEAGAARREALHRRALAALEGEGSPAAELARHALAAGAVEAAVRHSIRAGDASLAVFAVQDGIVHYERARGLLERGVTVPQDESVRLYANLGRAYDAAGVRDAARGAYEALLRAARASTPALAAEAFNLYLTRDGLRLDEARALLEEALPLAARAGAHAAEADMRLNIAQVAVMAWNLDAATREAGRARAVARAGGLAELEGRSLDLLALVALWAGHFDDSRARCMEAIATFRALAGRGAGATLTSPPLRQLWASAPWSPSWSHEAHLQGMEAHCHALLANVEVNRGEIAAGRSVGYAGLQLAEEARDDWGWAYIAVNLATALVEDGEYAEALRVEGRASEIARALPNTNLRPKVPLEAGAIHLALLDLARARAATLEALRLLGPEASATHVWWVLGLSRLCATYALAGEWGEAAVHARAAAESRARTGVEIVPKDFARYLETEALLRDGDEAAARRGIARLAARVGVNRRHRLVLTRMQAALARWESDAAGAIARLEDALRLAAGMGLPGERWAILAELVALRRERGEADAADEAAGQARAIVEELAARLGDTGLGRDFRARALARIAGQTIVHV